MRTSPLILLFSAIVLAPFHALAALPGEETIEQFREARQLLESDPEKAWELASELPEIRHADDVRVDLVANTALRTQRTSEALDALAELARTTDDDNEAFRSRLERAELLGMLGRLDDADALLDRLRKDRRKISGRSADRRYFYSRIERLEHDIARARDDTKTARRRARTLLLRYPTEHATRRDGLIIDADSLDDSDRYIRARNLMNSWGYHDARVEFERLKNHRKYSDVARWNLGIIGLRKLRDRPKEAEKLFRELIKEGYREQDAHWYLARSLMKQERYDDALEVFDSIAKRWPRGKYISSVYYYRGWLHYDHRDNEKAIRGLKEFVDKYGRRARKSTYVYGFLAWAYMREERWKDAIDVWDDMMPFGNTLVAGKALFWKAYAQNELGEEEAALETLDRLRDRYAISYYGMHGEQLRARIRDEDPRASKVWWPEGGGTIDDAPRIDVVKRRFRKLNKTERRRWNRVKTLALLGEKHLARKALGPIEGDLLAEIDSDEKDEWVHALGWFVGDYNEMWRRATGASISAMPGLPDPDALRSAMAYPRAYKEIVESVADEFDLPPELIWSIMRQESRYKPGAVSYTDAVGALQMIPKTARLVARDLGITYDVRTFFRPEVGFRFSGYYMKKLLDIFDGLYTPMAAGYNSGPKVVKRWFERNPEAPLPWLIEEFEYNEGRAYCRKVTEHMLRYLYLYESNVERRNRLLEQMFPLDRDVEFPDDVGY